MDLAIGPLFLILAILLVALVIVVAVLSNRS
jgi:hypothetical protein